MVTTLARDTAISPVQALEKVIAEGNLESLSPQERLQYYRDTCTSLGLNPLTQPFQYIRLQGKLTFYARKDATEQLRKIHGISIEPPQTEIVNDIYVVTVKARAADGRTDSDIGAVPIAGLKGESLANAMMKAITKAKRRTTLSICGLGFLDESETDSIPGAQLVQVDSETGAIVEQPQRQEAQRLPQPARTPTPPRDTPVVPSPSNAVTQKQMDLIFTLTRNLGWPDDDVDVACGDQIGVGTVDELTKAQASQFIDWLRTQESAESKSGTTPEGIKF